MDNSIFQTHYLKGHKVTVFGADEDHNIYYAVDYGCTRHAKQHYVCGFGGNPYPGTLICYYEIYLGNGKKTRLNVRA